MNSKSQKLEREIFAYTTNRAYKWNLTYNTNKQGNFRRNYNTNEESSRQNRNPYTVVGVNYYHAGVEEDEGDKKDPIEIITHRKGISKL